MENDLILTGDRLFKDGDMEKALDYYFKFLFDIGPNALVYMKIGHCNKVKGDNENAIEYYRKSLEYDGSNLETLYNCGESLIHINQPDEGIAMLQKVVDLTSRSGGNIGELARQKINEAKGNLYNRAGGQLLKEGRLDDALVAFQNAIEYNPRDKRNYANIGVVCLKQGDIDSSIKWMKKAIEVDPLYVRGYFNLGTIYIQKGWYQQAVKILTQAIEIDPDGRDSQDIRTNLDAAKQKFEEAKNELLDYSLGNKTRIANDHILNLINAIAYEKINSIDSQITNSGKLKFIAYGTENNYEISEADNDLKIREL